jgi:predicted RNase H-like nuclease (RuvC/YqgF family)
MDEKDFLNKEDIKAEKLIPMPRYGIISKVESIKNMVEIDFLKSKTYEEINEIINQFNKKIKELERENEMLLNYLKGSCKVNDELLDVLQKNKLSCGLTGALKMIEIKNFLESKK